MKTPTIWFRLVLVALLPAVVACHNWQPVSVPRTSQPLRRTYLVWVNDVSYELHALRVDGDSLSGIPAWRDPRDDTHRVSFLRSDVDAVRLEVDDTKGTIAIPLVILGLTILAAYSVPGSS